MKASKGPPLVSVVIPTFNREQYIQAALTSALAQNYPNLEIIVCDNYSSDNTVSICLDLAAQYTSIRVLQSSANIGPVKNWLKGVSHARGHYVKLLFSDDKFLSRSAIKLMVQYMTPKVGFVYSSCLVGSSLADAQISYSGFCASDTACSSHSSMRGLLAYPSSGSRLLPYSPCAALFRKTDLIESLTASIRDSSCSVQLSTGAGPDVYTYIYCLRKYPSFALIHKPLTFFRKHEASFTHGKLSKGIFDSYSNSLKQYYWDLGVAWYFSFYLLTFFSRVFRGLRNLSSRAWLLFLKAMTDSSG